MLIVHGRFRFQSATLVPPLLCLGAHGQARYNTVVCLCVCVCLSVSVCVAECYSCSRIKVRVSIGTFSWILIRYGFAK